MDVIEIEYSNFEEEIVNKYLLNEIFHVTFKETFESILNDGAIKSSRKNNLTRPNGKSYHSYAYNNDCVALFDLRNIDIESPNYQTALEFMPSNGYYLFLKNNVHEKIIPSSEVEYNTKDAFHIPEYECWFPEEIELGDVDKIFFIQNIEDNMSLEQWVGYRKSINEPISFVELASRMEKEKKFNGQQ